MLAAVARVEQQAGGTRKRRTAGHGATQRGRRSHVAHGRARALKDCPALSERTGYRWRNRPVAGANASGSPHAWGVRLRNTRRRIRVSTTAACEATLDAGATRSTAACARKWQRADRKSGIWAELHSKSARDCKDFIPTFEQSHLRRWWRCPGPGAAAQLA